VKPGFGTGFSQNRVLEPGYRKTGFWNRVIAKPGFGTGFSQNRVLEPGFRKTGFWNRVFAKLDKRHLRCIVDVDCLYVVSKFVRTRSCHSCGKEGGSDWLRLHFKGDSQFKAGPPLPPGFTSTSMPPQTSKKKKLFLAQFLLFFRTFFGGRTRSGVFPPRCPLQKSFLFLTQLLLFSPFFFLGRTRSGGTDGRTGGVLREHVLRMCAWLGKPDFSRQRPAD
jgi:hypothetical protein